jgi:NAD(P)-dependent dehydrogenase (short-subunit alcohol dehydrogenase family)
MIFMREKWNRNNIHDLTGKVIIVTGANSGIGFHDTKEFARKGASVVMGCRNMSKAQQAFDKIKREIPDAKIETIQLDLMSIKSIRNFSDQFMKKYDRLDVLVNNAGIMMQPYKKTLDGFESQMGTNHLGHFALTALLYDYLEKTKGSRIVNVSSVAHRSGNIDFENFMFEKEGTYNRSQSYSNSKIANLLFTYELDRRLKNADSTTTAVASHPGLSSTNLANHMMGGKVIGAILKALFFWILQSAAKGALPTIKAAVDPNVQGGQYFGPKGIFGGEIRGYPGVVQSNEKSHNEDDAKKLWDISEKLTGIKFDI